MARPKREGDFSQLTVRLSVDSGRRLRVAAARRGTTPGRILDELILAALPPADPLPPSAAADRDAAEPLTIEWLRERMTSKGLNQSDLARALTLNPKSISDWFIQGRIPTQRWRVLRRLLGGRPRP